MRSRTSLAEAPPYGPRGGFCSFTIKRRVYGSPLGGRRGGHSIAFVGPFVRQLGQIVGLELDAVQLVVAPQLLDLLLALLTRQGVLAVLVTGELLVELFLRELLPPLLLRAKRLGDGEEGHDGVVVERIDLYLVEDLQRVRQRLGDVAEDLVHLSLRLEPLLLGIEHARGVVEVLARRETQQVVVGLGILLVDEVHVVRADELDAILPGQVHEHAVGLLLQGEGLAVGTDRGVLHLVSLQLEIIVVAKDAPIPLHGLAGTVDVAVEDFLGHLAGDACRADDEPLVVALQVFAVGTRTHVIAVHPCPRHELDQVLVARIVLCQHDQVVAALVLLAASQQLRAVSRHIHLATKDRYERLQPFLLALLVHVADDVVKFLDAEHVAMVGDGHAPHAVLQGFVYQTLNLRLAVEDREVGMYV